MKRTTMVLGLGLCVMCCAAAWAQEAPARPEGVDASVQKSIQMSQNKYWTPSEPAKNVGVVITIRLVPKGTFKPEEFALKFGEPKDKNTAPCIGYTSAGMWFVSKDEQQPLTGMTLYMGEKAAEIPFLFVVPKEATEVTVLYKGEPAGKPLALKGGKS